MYTDEEIILGLQNRDGAVTVYLQRQYFTMIRYIVGRKGGSDEDAKDMFNDVMLVLLPKVDDPDFRLTCRFKTFFYAISDNMWKLKLEKKRIAGLYQYKKRDEPGNIDFTENYDRHMMRELLDNSFYKLRPLCQKIIRMFWNEVPQKQMAELLGFTYGYLRKRKFICQKRLVESILSNEDNVKILTDRLPEVMRIKR